ncbi:DUF2846 domain-containing protein [Hydrogenophaga sp.]|uniref:DUF2846 domain-containing protein n=1 Tax=Hydrogenophaga sp. TaxID=1904254 RepID=UPI003D0B595C
MGSARWWVLVWAGVCVLFLSGCAATGLNYASVSGSLPPLKENGCRVFFYRSGSIVGAALQPEIRLDLQVVGRSQPGGFFYVDTVPGRHLASSQTEVEARLEFDIEAGQTLYVESSIGFGLLVGRVQLNLKPEGTALADLSSLRYTGTEVLVAQPASPPVVARELPRGRVTMDDLEALLPPTAQGGAR